MHVAGPMRVALAVLLMAGACGPSPSASVRPPPSAETSKPAPSEPAPLAASVPVRIGVLGILGEAGVYVAMARGYFQAEGLEPTLVTFDSATKALPALGTGEMDVLLASMSPGYVNAVRRGLAMTIVASLGTGGSDSNSSWLVARPELANSGEVRTWADLRGRTLAIPGFGNFNDYAIARALERAGVPLSEVQRVELSFTDQLPALANGRIDAGALAEPLATVAAERGIATKVRATSNDVLGIVTGLVIYPAAFMTQQPEAAERWLVAYLRGVRAYNAAFTQGTDRAEVVRTLTEYTSVKDPTLYDRMPMNTMLRSANGEVNLANLADQVSWYAEQGLMPADVDVGALVDRQVLETALVRLSQYPP
jgi:NitT/TauT family transport system substrate-binding protein